MPKNKKGAFGKRSARKRAAGAIASASANQKRTINYGRSSSNNLTKWSAETSLVGLTLPGTTMQQLALNTRNKTSHWDQNSSLRGRPVTFVSGGFVEPSDDAKVLDCVPPSQVATSLPTSNEAICSNNSKAPQVKTITEDGAESFQCLLSADDNSSDEEILFKGRGALQDMRPSAHTKIMPEPRQALANNTVSTSSPMHLTPAGSSGLGHLIAESDDEGGSDAAINDYIENMTSEDMADFVRHLSANRRELGDAQNDIVVDVRSGGSASSGELGADTDDITNHGSDGDNDGGADEDIDSDIASATEEPHRHDKSPNKLTKSRHSQTQMDDDSSSNNSDDEWQLAADIDDEHFARLLAKQEEFGMGGDDLILFDTTPRRRAARKQGKRSKGLPPWQAAYDFTKSYGTSRGSYPSAEAIADAFEQLEVTGWAKNRDEFHLQLSDSELEMTLKTSWQKDRLRKKEKRKARDELRSRGLLKKNANPNDPRIKYPNGMSLDDMKSEFQSFLVGSEQCVTLSPMDAHARKVVHEIAYRFNIASKSTGSGDQRRPTLVRKKATLRFDDELFQDVFAKYQRRFFARMDGNRSGTGLHRKTLGRKGGGPGAATVRNGEVVGGSAPEIGIQNKGRTMLEKMGWSTGMALGALDNKGMTQIIEHVVKRSKAGLG